MTAALVPTAVLTVCCGGHRPGGCCRADCAPCCPECVTCPEVHLRTPRQRAADAAEMRERQMLVRVSAARAEHVATIAALDELAAELERKTRLLVDVAVEDYQSGTAQDALETLNAAVDEFALRYGSIS